MFLYKIKTRTEVRDKVKVEDYFVTAKKREEAIKKVVENCRNHYSTFCKVDIAIIVKYGKRSAESVYKKIG